MSVSRLSVSRDFVEIIPRAELVCLSSSSDVHALGPGMNPPALGPTAECVLALEDKIAPLALGLGPAASGRDVVVRADAVAADHLGQDLHPALLVLSTVRVEVDDFAVIEADAESFLNEHVPFLLLGEGRPPALSVLGGGLLLCEGPAVVDQSLGIT